MQMTITVGTQERHEVVFSFDQFWGRLLITVDGQSVIDTVQLASLSTVASWEFTVGVREVHHVEITKRRTVLFSGFRPQDVTALVDGQVVAQRTTSVEAGDVNRMWMYIGIAVVSIAILCLIAVIGLAVVGLASLAW